MRLHRLRLTAFQAFAGSEQVDFDGLSESGLFLLHGDTGAGKTTLLDAVAFALYGDVPGARSRDARLRSDHAAPEVRTEVELEVTLRERRVRIIRRPAQERPKLRGEGTTREPPACTVQELDAASGEWTALASRRDEADAELIDLLGMSCEQFCQVVLLPQGEFATFLRADSGERQAVLERLFGTDRFTRVEHWLTDRRKAAWAELRDAMQDVRDVVSRVSEVAGEPPPEGWEHDLDGLPAWVGGIATHADASQATAAAAREAAGAERVVAERALAEGRALAERRARHVTAVAELAAWQERLPARAAAEAELAAAERAAPLAGLLTSRLAIYTDTAGTNGQSSPRELRARAAEARGEAGALDALVAVEERLARDEAELARLAAQADQAAVEARAAEQALVELAVERTALEATVKAARDAAASAERLTAEAGTAAQRAEQGAERDRLSAEREQVHERRRTAIDAEQQAHRAWLDLRERRLAGMAAELAEGLQPGEPCAVCGATEHPAPAHLQPTPAREDPAALRAVNAPSLDARPAALDESRPLAEREQQAEADHARRAADRASAERKVSEIEAALAAARAVAGKDPADALAAIAERLAAELETARAEAAKGSEAQQRLVTLDASTQEHQQAQKQATHAEATARATHAERSRALEADRVRIEQARGDAPTVAARAEALRTEADAAEQEAAACDAGFADAAAARAALRDDEARAELRARIEQFDTGLAERRAQAEDADLKAAATAPAPDLDALEAPARTAIEADEQATRHHGLAEQRLAALRRLSEQLEQALVTLEPVAEQERLIRELAGLVDGSAAANRLRMRLSAYVLAARLEEVAAAATVRLERMSNGRYQLVHTDERARGERRAGLELRVVDGWTGQERPPATLSGGETFLASLALALGLADVVAAEAGGSRLETLFVDEGFGSLDERTLDEVLDVLDALREGGRTVGIVSHVAELRQRIPTRLRVVKGRGGSRVEHEQAATTSPA
ncbi:MAG TPA: SMC family ATPase [Conexibacter sp.]|nr:SMC family ATPase [Conexibacter sp.]